MRDDTIHPVTSQYLAGSSLSFAQYTTPGQVTAPLREDMVDCWVEVSNAGGAAGFPFPPVDHSHAAPALDRIVASLAPEASRLLTALHGGELVGWLNLRRDTFALVAHWGMLHHVQTRPSIRAAASVPP